MYNLIEKFFHLRENNTNIRTEILAGVTTFLVMAYILAVNSAILGDAGMPKGGVFVATALAAAFGTAVMAFFSNYPFALAPGMSINAYFAYMVILGMGYSWQAALLSVFVSGLLFMLLVITGLGKAIFNVIPMSLKYAMGAGVGLFITLLALENAHIIVDNQATLVGFQTIGSYNIHTRGICVILALAGVIVIAALRYFKFKTAILLGIFITWLLGILAQLTGIYWVDPVQKCFSLYPNLSLEAYQTHFQEFGEICGALFLPESWTLTARGTVIESGWPILLSANFITVVLSFLFIDVFDTLGTVIGVVSRGNFLAADGSLKRSERLLMTDAISTSAGAVFGVPVTTAYVESAAGFASGGKTGLASVITSLLFLAALLFAPVFLSLPGFAAAPALIVVGVMMISTAKKIDFNDIPEAVPAFITIVTIPFTCSISDGVALGMISWTFLHLFCGKSKKIPLLMYVLTILFILKLFCAS